MKEVTEYKWTATYRELPADQRFCLPCNEPLDRLSKTWGCRTWQCPTCEKLYSDIRTFSGMGNQGAAPSLEELAARRREGE